MTWWEIQRKHRKRWRRLLEGLPTLQCFFFNDTATTEIYTLSLHDALPISQMAIGFQMAGPTLTPETFRDGMFAYPRKLGPAGSWGFGESDYTTADDVREICWDPNRSEEHTSELQSRLHLVCRLLLEKKKKK